MNINSYKKRAKKSFVETSEMVDKQTNKTMIRWNMKKLKAEESTTMCRPPAEF